MKKVYSKSSRQGLPGGPNEMFQKVKGIIVSERGQWDFPGMNTLVPTQDGRITMRGVPYPVLGQDETGYTQMMYPEQEYQFPGQNVLELPMAQNGLSTPIINLPEYTVIDEKIPENIRLANTAKRLVEELYDVSRPAAGFTEKISDLFIPGEKKYYDNTCVKGVCDIFKEANLNSGIPEDVLNNKDFLENYSKYGFTLVPNEQLQVGDIIQYYEKDRPTHLGIYVGDDEYVGDGSKDKPLVKSNIHKYPDGKDKLPFRAFRKNFKSGGSLPKAQPGLQTENPNEVKYGTPEYEQAYNQGTLTTSLSGDPEDFVRARTLPEFKITPQYTSLRDDLSRAAVLGVKGAAELTGIPGTVRFAQNPVTSLKGAGNTLVDLGMTVGAFARMNPAGGFQYATQGVNPLTGEGSFRAEDVEGAFNTLDAVGTATVLGSALKAPVTAGMKQAVNTIPKGVVDYGKDLAYSIPRGKLPQYANAVRWQPDEIPGFLKAGNLNLTDEQKALKGSWYGYDPATFNSSLSNPNQKSDVLSGLGFYPQTRPGPGNVLVNRLSERQIRNLEKSMSPAAKGMSGKPKSVTVSDDYLQGELTLPPEIRNNPNMNIRFDVNPSEYLSPNYSNKDFSTLSLPEKTLFRKEIGEGVSNIINSNYQPIKFAGVSVPRKYFPFQDGGSLPKAQTLGQFNPQVFKPNPLTGQYSWEQKPIKKTNLTPKMQPAVRATTNVQRPGFNLDRDNRLLDAGLQNTNVSSNPLSPYVHTLLDAAGMVPILGEPADFANALLYNYEGDLENAATSTAGMIPILGMLGTGKRLLGKAGKGFKSEIDWRNWVKYKEDFDNNPQVIQELIDIEKRTKADGTWMKNPDGSPFQGTPEQFVVQQSSKFKDAYKEGFETVWRGGDRKPELNTKYSSEGDVVFTTKDEYGGHAYNRADNPHIKLSDTDTPPEGLSKLYAPKTKNKIVIDGDNSYMSEGRLIKNDRLRKEYGRLNVIDQNPSTPLEKENLNTFINWMKVNRPGVDLKDRVMTDNFASFLNSPQGRNIDRVEFIKIYDGTEFPINVEVHNLNNKKQLKSMFGNILFDMSNPNIYKALAPIMGLGVVGTYGANQLMNQQPESYKRGGSLPKAQNGEDLFPGEGMYYQIPEYTFEYKRRFSDLPTPRYTGPLMSQQLIDEATQREYEQRRRAIDESIAATRNPFSAERLAKESATTGDKLSLQMMFGDPYNSPRVYEALGGLDFINPAVMLGDMATGLGALPYNIQEGNYGSAALGLVAPLATGALASIGVKSARGFINNLVNPFAGIGDTPRQIPGSPNAVSVVDDVSRVVADTPQPWQMQELPGLHLKSTMTEGPISKIVEPKTGLVNVEQALGIIGKESGGADKVALIKQGLGDNIPKKMDYNEFRKVVQDQLIPLERQFSEQASNYGVGRLGYPSAKRSSYEKAIEHNQNMIEHYKKQIAAGSDNSSLKGDLQNAINNLENSKKELATLPLENQTLILGNKFKFGRGSSAHGNPDETLGHIHFLRDAETPDVLTVTQIQSDAFQGTHRTMPKSKESLLKDIETGWATDEGIENFTQKQLLDKNHQERFLQELVDYAASRGDINKMRLPTSETAAKVQNYDKIKPVTDPVEIAKIKRQIEAGKKRAAEAPTKDKEKWERGVRSLQLELNGGYEFQHQTILKKYSEQPKTIKKLFGKEPRIVTDSKGNTWYEFDIPEKFKQGKGEIKAYQRGGDTYNMQRALELGYTPDETSHWPSVDSTNGMWLKSKQHPTAWMESMYGYQLNPEVYNNYNVTYNPEGYFGENQLQYVPKKFGGSLPTAGDPVLNFIQSQSPRFSKSKK